MDFWIQRTRLRTSRIWMNSSTRIPGRRFGEKHALKNPSPERWRGRSHSPESDTESRGSQECTFLRRKDHGRSRSNTPRASAMKSRTGSSPPVATTPLTSSPKIV